MGRSFTDSLAVRSAVPLLVGLVGPSGSGKTYSALRLATGMQRMLGGDIGGIDTEANRMLHYAEGFKFRHLPFGAPFDPLSYLDAVEHFAKKGVKTIIIDSASHMHEGPGGTLEAHAKEMGGDFKKSMLAWQKPKADLRRFLNTVLQLQVNTIWCFRAKDKVKVVQGKDPKPMGFQPVAGDEMFYEMTVSCLLYPNSGGVPSWQPEEMGERAVIKQPRQFEALFKERKPLDEATGEALAKWAAGGSAQSASAAPSTPSAPSKAGSGTSMPPANDSASASATTSPGLDMLAAQLGANGINTKEARREWVKEFTGKTIAQLTDDDIAKCIERAESEAA